MNKLPLGSTGISVSRLCFGTLTMGPFQRGLAPAKGAALIERAFERGVNFLDTAEIYETYPHVKLALRAKPDAVVCTKSYSYDAATAEASFVKAVKGIGRDYIDVFLLHEQESAHTIRGHREAIEYFIRRKEQGYIGAFGLSTHYIGCMRAALKYPELQVLFPLINKKGVGIADGTAEEMLEVIREAHDMGKGIIAIDESSSTCKKRFDGVGIECTEENRRAYRELLLSQGRVLNQIKPVIVLNTPERKDFFYARIKEEATAE